MFTENCRRHAFCKSDSNERMFSVRQCQQQRQSVLPSFREVFEPYTLSMNSSIEHFLEPHRRKDLGITKSFHHKIHPKKSALKRHLEQEKVLVQPVQNDIHVAKRFRSDWDLLFYNNSDSFNASGGNKIPLSTECKKKRQSFLVRGKEMKSFFHLLGCYLLSILFPFYC